MRVSLQWLSDYVDLVVDAEELADRLTNAGTSVESVERVTGGWDGCVVGRVLEVFPHPRADRLSVCRVDVGGEVKEIVCGAPNVRAGMLSPVALPGARIADGKLVGEAEIRGVRSWGMLLSEKELGISDDAEGVMVLEEGMEPGTDLHLALGLEDTVLILEITPNRPDCLSMLGIAREVAALTGQALRRPRIQVYEEGPPAEEEVRVEILDEEKCSRYVARLIDEVKVGPSPWWMRKRLRAAGIRPISNVVDVTNYVMLEMGQPLHAFDYHLLKEGHIIVRRAEPGDRLVTLDGVKRDLHPEDLLICDPGGPVALAGVMGGELSEVSSRTSKVLLESAHFEPSGIMRTSRRHDLSSEASYRFERGVDPDGCLPAADRAAGLIAELAGGKVRPGAVDVRARSVAPRRLELRVERAGRLIGITLNKEEASRILESLELKVVGISEDRLRVEVPTFRPDLEREIDLVEELARIYGYQRIPATLPRTSHNVGFLTREQRLRREIARVMAGCGLHEAITVSFVPGWWLEVLDPERRHLPPQPLRLRNPLSEEASMLRPSLLPGLLEAVRFNLNRRLVDVHLFEMGRVFLPLEGRKLPQEPLRLGAVLTGRWLPKPWDGEAQDCDFYTMKGILEVLMRTLHVEDWELESGEGPPFLHPMRRGTVMLEGKEAGYMGTLHPRVAENLDIPGAEVMEVEVAALVEAAKDLPPFKEIPRFPSVQVDLALVVDEEVPAAEVERVIRSAGGDLLREVRLFDLYRGAQIGKGEKSLAYSLVFYSLERTLREDEVREIVEGVVGALAAELGARLR